jgi:hypothetical protein
MLSFRGRSLPEESWADFGLAWKTLLSRNIPAQVRDEMEPPYYCRDSGGTRLFAR